MANNLFKTWSHSYGWIKYMLLSVFLISTCLIHTQELTISGIVSDEQTGETLIGVSVFAPVSDRGAVSDIDGTYSLTIPGPEKVQFSYVGYQTFEVEVNESVTLNISLVPDVNIMDEVVVTGYRKEIKSNISGSISSVNAEDIEQLSVLSMEQALQGQVAGLQVTQVTGAPGDDIAVRIRGASTLGNNNPLYIIDGIPTTGNINMFSLRDVESIQVLKDGAAASIYGSRAANGVILITTKSGQSGEPSFSFESYYGVQESVNLPELLNAREYLTIRNEAITNANTLRDDRRQLDTYPLGMLDTLADVNWLDELFNPAAMQRYSLSATGGGEHSSFYLLGEYLNQDGVYRGQSFEKYLLRFNGQTKKGIFTVGNKFSLGFTDRDVINSSGDGAGPGNELNGIRYTLIAAPVFPIYDDEGNYINTSNVLGDPFLYGDGNANPLAFVDATNWNVKRYRGFGNVFAEIQPIPSLTLRTNLGIDFVQTNERVFKERLSAAIYDPSSLSEGRTSEQNLVWNNTADFQQKLGDTKQHLASVLIGMEAIDNRINHLGASARNFLRTNPLFRYFENNVNSELGDIGVSGITTSWGLLSYFAQAGYSYDSKYIINTSVRRDGSSRFGKNNRWGTFPAVSLAWNVSREKFMEALPLVSHLKVRASWGQLGNQEIGVYPYSSLVQTGQFVYPFGGNIVTGATIVETGNDNIKWETTTQTDLGFELSLWEDQLTILGDFYTKNTEDVLVRIPIPQTAGAVNPPFVNAGEIQNKGMDWSLIFKNRSGAWDYSISANFSTVKNKVLALSGSEPILGGFGLSDGPITRTEVGYPIGSFYLYDAIGIFQTMEEIDASPFQTQDTRPGDIKFADINGDMIIDDKDRAHLGNPFPDYIFGLSASVNYKNFDLSVLMQGVQGNDVYFLYGNFAYETPSRGFNSYKEILNRWTPDNRETSIPKVSLDDRNGNRRVSTRFLEDGSYIRCRNISLGYDFTDLINMNWIKGLHWYVSSQNLFTITKYPGLDPEIQANTNDTQGFNVSSDLAVGIDWGTVPAPRIWMTGIRIDF